MEDLTPREIVAELDKYIVGQQAAKRAVAIALRNRYRRRLLAEDLATRSFPKNILMIRADRCRQNGDRPAAGVPGPRPVCKVEATKFTEVGYVGRDVDSMVRDLVQASLRIVEREKMDEVREKAQERAVDRIVDLMQPRREPKPTRIRIPKQGSSENPLEALAQFSRRAVRWHRKPKPETARKAARKKAATR